MKIQSGDNVSEAGPVEHQLGVNRISDEDCLLDTGVLLHGASVIQGLAQVASRLNLGEGVAKDDCYLKNVLRKFV